MTWLDRLTSSRDSDVTPEDHRHSGWCTGVAHMFPDPTTGIALCGDLVDPLPADDTRDSVECPTCLRKRGDEMSWFDRVTAEALSRRRSGVWSPP